MKKFFWISLVLLLSCTKEMNQTDLQKESVSTEPSSTTIPLSEALNSLSSMVHALAGTTKASFSFDQCEICTVGCCDFSLETKSTTISIPDTLMYVVNFSENKGFAVLAGDTRLSERVYCLTEAGSISSDDFASAFNYLQTLPTKNNTTSEDREEFYDIGETFVSALLLSSMMADLEYGAIQDPDTKVTDVTNNTVLLKTKWTQWEPFNTYTCDENGNRCPTGCVATACAQIMEYCQKPTNPVFDGVLCSWADMSTVCSYSDRNCVYATSEAKEQVARFLYHIGKRSLCYIRYATDGSYGYADGVVRTLKNYGYSNVKKHTGFGSSNQSKASSMLANNRPVYLDGSDYHNGGGHAWVIDGEWNEYFHCNWGWKGKWDGYYAKHNYFPVSSRAYKDSIDPESTDSSLGGCNYDWNFRMITYSL